MLRTTMLAALMFVTPVAARTIPVTPGGDAQEAIQAALIDAQPGDIVEIAAGRYALTDGLSLDVDNVTVRGAGADRTILSFKGQEGAGEGLLVTSDRVLLTGFAVEDTRGDGIKSKGSDRITFQDLRVEWTGGPKESNGAYGVYPVTSTNVLIERVTVTGASDAGIYVGQSRNIVVRRSTATHNVAGIEIENSYDADVHDNVATRNTAGVLVFDLPNLPQMGGHSTRVFANRIVDNDTPNFAPKGNIVASVPVGTGVMVMANRNVEVFGNRFDGNGGAQVMVLAYRMKFDDKSYNPLPREVFVGANDYGRGGFAPAFPGGAEIARAVGGMLPPVIWDGVVRYGEGAAYSGQPLIHAGRTLTLGLVKAGTPAEQARPTMVDLSPRAAPRRVAAVVLPKDQPGT